MKYSLLFPLARDKVIKVQLYNTICSECVTYIIQISSVQFKYFIHLSLKVHFKASSSADTRKETFDTINSYKIMHIFLLLSVEKLLGA